MSDRIGELTDEVLAAYADGLEIDIIEAVDLVPLLAAKLLQWRENARTGEKPVVVAPEVATSQVLFAAIKHAGGRLSITDREMLEMKGATIWVFRPNDSTTYVLETGVLKKMTNDTGLLPYQQKLISKMEATHRLNELYAGDPNWAAPRYFGVNDPTVPLPKEYAKLMAPPPSIDSSIDPSLVRAAEEETKAVKEIQEELNREARKTDSLAERLVRKMKGDALADQLRAHKK